MSKVITIEIADEIYQDAVEICRIDNTALTEVVVYFLSRWVKGRRPDIRRQHQAISTSQEELSEAQPEEAVSEKDNRTGKDLQWCPTQEWLRLRKEVTRRDHYRCVRCDKHFSHGSGLTVHHIIPRNKGGGDCLDNLVSLCPRCHDYVEVRSDELCNIAAIIGSSSEAKARFSVLEVAPQ